LLLASNEICDWVISESTLNGVRDPRYETKKALLLVVAVALQLIVIVVKPIKEWAIRLRGVGTHRAINILTEAVKVVGGILDGLKLVIENVLHNLRMQIVVVSQAIVVGMQIDLVLLIN